MFLDLKGMSGASRNCPPRNIWSNPPLTPFSWEEAGLKGAAVLETSFPRSSINRHRLVGTPAPPFLCVPGTLISASLVPRWSLPGFLFPSFWWGFHSVDLLADYCGSLAMAEDSVALMLELRYFSSLQFDSAPFSYGPPVPWDRCNFPYFGFVKATQLSETGNLTNWTD